MHGATIKTFRAVYLSWRVQIKRDRWVFESTWLYTH